MQSPQVDGLLYDRLSAPTQRQDATVGVDRVGVKGIVSGPDNDNMSRLLWRDCRGGRQADRQNSRGSTQVVMKEDR